MGQTRPSSVDFRQIEASRGGDYAWHKICNLYGYDAVGTDSGDSYGSYLEHVELKQLCLGFRRLL